MSDFKDILLRQFRIDLLERDKNPISSLYKLKYNYDYSDICFIVDNLHVQNRIEELIYGCTIPESIRDLGNTQVIFGDSNDELEKEINWALLSVRKYDEKLNYFIKLKTIYEESLIVGDYKLAESTLNRIENEICISLWGIEQRFIIIELQKGLKENTNFLNEINEQNTKWFIKYFSHFYSIKAEKELSVNQYQLALARLLFKYYENKKHVDLSYYNFKLNYLEEVSIEYLPIFLTVEGYHSIIDRYITLLRIFQIEVLKNNKDNKSMIDSRLYYLSKKINDPLVNKLRLVHGTEFEYKFELSQNDYFSVKAIDEYSKGNYSVAEKLLFDCISKMPLAIELYDLYVKSLIVQNKPLVPIGKNIESFQNRILTDFHNILSKEINVNESLNDLRRIAYNLSSFFSVSFYLMNYYKSEIENKNDWMPISIINSSFFNPTTINIIENSNVHYDYLVNHFDSSSTFHLLKLQSETNIEKIKQSDISDIRKKILIAKVLQKDKRTFEASEHLNEILESVDLKNFQRVSILALLYYCKFEEKEYDDCISIYVDNYLKNPLLVSKINTQSLKKIIKIDRLKSVSHTINLPLFYKFSNAEDYEVHTAYECFILNQDCEIPSELISKSSNIDLKKQIVFLDSICTLDILKHSPFITSTKQKINERISVCKFLSEINTEFKEAYLQDVEILTKKLIILKGLQEIDESKIYVNQQGIIDSELKNLKSLFNRYQAIGELKSEKDIRIVSLYSDKVLSFKVSDKDDENGSEISKDPQFDIYKDIFNYILDKFLFSNYGLQQYLSARIRHGVLLGEIRPEFEILYLITEKEKGVDVYKRNSHWNYFFNMFGEEKSMLCQEHLAHFSNEVDMLINDEILSKYLQIRIEDKNTDGWLDYVFNDTTLQVNYVLYNVHSNLNQLIDDVFIMLWERTNNNLEKIRSIINSEIKEKFFALIFKLENNIENVIGQHSSELFNNLTEARINIENKLNKIANWFNITDSNISDFNFSKIVDVSVECTHNTNLNKYLKPNVSLDCLCEFKGCYFPPLVDLLRIFLENALKHSGFEKGEIPIYIVVIEKDDNIQITIKNPLHDSVNISELKNKICSFSLDLNKSMYEDRSGFHKALRIIKSDLNNYSNNMTLTIDDDSQFTIEITINKINLIL